LLETPQKRAKVYLNISDIDYFKPRCCWDFTRKLILCWLWLCMHLKSCKMSQWNLTCLWRQAKLAHWGLGRSSIVGKKSLRAL
jgi:hypothetical protein